MKPYNEEEMPTARDFHATVIKDNFMYVIGGLEKMGRVNEIYTFSLDPLIPPSTLNSDFVSLCFKLTNFLEESITVL